MRAACVKSRHFRIEGTIISHLAQSPIQPKEAKQISSDKYDKLSTVSYSFRIIQKRLYLHGVQQVEHLSESFHSLNPNNKTEFVSLNSQLFRCCRDRTKVEKLIVNKSTDIPVSLHIKRFK